MDKNDTLKAKEDFTKLVELPSPTWLTAEKYAKYLDSHNPLNKKGFDMNQVMSSVLGYFPQQGEYHIDKAFDSWNVIATPEFHYNLYLQEKLISPAESGQDPKSYSKVNLETAADHSANQWGYWPKGKNGVLDNGYINPAAPSLWINHGAFNVVQIDGKVCIIPIDVEHRNWGLIGFPLGCVPMGNPEEGIYFYHNDLPEVDFCEVTRKTYRRIKINGLYLREIVQACHEAGATLISESDIQKRFWQNTFKYTFLPNFDRQKQEDYFRRVNKVSKKSAVQLFHADSNPNLYWIKDFSSIKVTRFLASEKKLHPLFELMTDKALVSLESMMIAVSISQYNVGNKKLFDTSDSRLIPSFKKVLEFDDELKSTITEDLDFVYSLVSKYINKNNNSNLKISRTLSLYLTHMKNELDKDDFVIYDKSLFINSFQEWFEEEVVDLTGGVTPFAKAWRTASSFKDCYKIIKSKFLHRMNPDDLLKIGVVEKSNSLMRDYSRDLLNKRYKECGGIDVDGEHFVHPEAAHIISQMELIRMTESERNQAFKGEGLGDTFDYEKNCMAMSMYHNRRMSCLRLSEYKEIMNESDEVVKLAVSNKYNELKSKDILV
jgi:hypothetical protein